MKTYEIILLILFLIWVVAIPYLKKFKVYEFAVLIIMPFTISYVLYNSYQTHQFSKYFVFLSLFFIGGLIYQAVKFYKKFLDNSIE